MQSYQKMFLAAALGCAVMNGQNAETAGNQPEPQTTLHAETRVVLVDAVVTDKKGAYIHDLNAKDFRVWEDNREQKITSFSTESDPAGPNKNEPHYLVLFFDNSTMSPSDQTYARKAAGDFIDSNAGPNRLMAIIDFGGSLRITQNFTADVDRLKKVVSGTKFSSVSPNGDPTLANTSLNSAMSNFGIRDVLMALRGLAKNLSVVPGRKTLVMLTDGFQISPEIMSELTATIDACNKANVAIYPIDVRGLVAPMSRNVEPEDVPATPASKLHSLFSALTNFGGGFSPGVSSSSFLQHGGSAGGGSGASGGSHGGGTSSGTGTTSGGTGTRGGGAGTGSTGTGSTGSRGGTTSSGTGKGSSGNTGMGSPYMNNPNYQSRQIIPPFPPSASDNQQPLYALASGTGGFVIANTNDLLGGLEKIGKEQNEYYLLGYTPDESEEGSCHTLRVKVERAGTNVRARSGYCNVRPKDLLAGNSVEKSLETRAASSQAPQYRGSIEAPFFYTSSSTARVDVSMEIPAEAANFQKQKGKLHSDVNIVGIAAKPDGTVAARFSDTVKLDLDKKKDLQDFQEKPVYYENQFDIAPGQYTLKVAFTSDGQSFGKLETPLNIEPYDGQHFGLSALALSNQMHKSSSSDLGLDAALMEDRVPLVTQGFQIVPSGSNHFKKTEQAFLYTEIYDPLLLSAPETKLGVQLVIVDKAGKQAFDTGLFEVTKMIHAGNSMVPVGVKLPVDKLAPGTYRAALKAADSSGNSKIRTTDFEVE